MSEFVIWFCVGFIFFGAIGVLIGQRKGRPLAGMVWGMLLGPFGWLLMALLPHSGAAKRRACPHCGGVVALEQTRCNHCGNAIRWYQGKAFKPSRAA